MSSYDPHLFNELAEVEEASFWFRSRNALIVWALRRYAGTAWTDLLEVGCGTGFVLAEIRRGFPNASLTGSDLFEEGLAIARHRVPSAQITQIDLLDMPYREAFDVVGAFDVIEHIADDRAALQGIAQATRSGGLVFLTVPQHPALWSQQDVAARHARRYSQGRLHWLVAEAGLELVRSTSFVSILMPALLVTRRLPSRSTVDDLRRPPVIDALLSGVMAVERAAIRAGFSFPIGGSRLLVARRP